MELAQAYRRFGSRVTVIEHGARLAGREDPDISDELRRILEAEGIEVWLSAEVEQVDDVQAITSVPAFALRMATEPSRVRTFWSPRAGRRTREASASKRTGSN